MPLFIGMAMVGVIVTAGCVRHFCMSSARCPCA
jgi:hypothetical protein